MGRDVVRAMATTLLLVLLAALPTAHGHASDLIQGYCNTPLTIGTTIMGAKARASSAAVVASRGGVGLAADNLFYTPGETLKLSLTNVNGEIAWEATGGAKFTTSAGCTNGKRSAARAPFLVMPVGGVNTVQIWAGHASGHNAVSITPTITLTPRAPPPTTPAPTNSAVVAPGGGGGVVTPAAPTTPAPTPSPASSSNSGKTNVYAAVFNARVSTVIAANFRVDIAQTLVADTATLVPSQVYVVASAPSLFRRFLQAGSSATDVTIRLTNLPDLATANALVGTVGSYLQSPLATGFGAQYGNAAATPGTPTVVLQSSAATTFTVGALHASCVLDARQGVALSWQLDPDLQYVDLQVEGKGEGWLAGGLVDAHTSMVSTPPHKVLLFDYGTGEAQFLRMQGYEAVDLKPADAATYGVSPIFLQGAEGKVYMRYRQSLATASVPVDLGATTNFMWAWAEFGYPAMHDLEGDTIINWAAGTCTPRMNLPPIEGYWLLLVPFLALLVTWTFLKSTECGRGLLQRRLAAITPLPAWVQTFTGHSLPTLQNLKLGEASVMIIYILLQAALLLYWSLQEGGLGFKSTGIAFGKAGLTNLMMTYLPVSKTSVWVQVCGLSFERAVKFHRQLSYLAMGTMLIHLVCLAQVGPVWQTTALESGVVIAYGLLAFASFSVMSLTAMLRRWCYELFRYAHYLYIVGTVFVLLHAPGAWQYMLVPCLVHFMDVGRRWVSIWCCPTTARLHTFPDQITQIDVFSSSAAAADGKWKKPLEPGSYAFVCLPAVSRFQWHPISLSTAGSVVGNGDALFSLHVKALGKGTWTNQVYQLAAQGPATPHSHETTAQVTSDDATTASAPPLPLTIWVDGPYGKLSLNLGDYSKLVLVAGGIGLTPMTSILSYISHQKSNQQLPVLEGVTLVWVVRNEALFDGFALWLEQMLLELNMQQRGFFTLELYVTGGPKEEEGAGGIKKAKVKQLGARFVDGGAGGGHTTASQVRTHQGRPNLFQLFEALAPATTTTGVLACAPKGLLLQVQRQCVLRDLDVHMEEFAW